VARPFKGLDLELIEKLASIHCSNKEIAAMVGCDPSLLSKKNYSAIIDKGRERGKISLRNVTMMIWLSKNYLSMTDKVEEKISSEVNQHIQYDTQFGVDLSKDNESS
jgi:hypothetical protein